MKRVRPAPTPDGYVLVDGHELAIFPADPVHPRIDTVMELQSGRELFVLTGVPSVRPSAPVARAGWRTIANIYVKPNTSAIQASDITEWGAELRIETRYRRNWGFKLAGLFIWLAGHALRLPYLEYTVNGGRPARMDFRWSLEVKANAE